MNSFCVVIINDLCVMHRVCDSFLIRDYFQFCANKQISRFTTNPISFSIFLRSLFNSFFATKMVVFDFHPIDQILQHLNSFDHPPTHVHHHTPACSSSFFDKNLTNLPSNFYSSSHNINHYHTHFKLSSTNFTDTSQLGNGTEKVDIPESHQLPADDDTVFFLNNKNV